MAIEASPTLNEPVPANVCAQMVESATRSCQPLIEVPPETVNTTADSLAMLSTAFTFGSIMLAILAIAVAVPWARSVASAARIEAEAAAKKTATAAALEAISEQQAEIQLALDSAKAAADAAKQYALEANTLVFEIKQDQKTVKGVTDKLTAFQEPKDERMRKDIKDIAQSAEAKSKRDRSAAEYRALISSAIIDKDWSSLADYAQAMETLFDTGDPEEDLAFALFGRAFAADELGEHEQAVPLYRRIADTFSDSEEEPLREYAAKALVNMATAQGMLGESDAELETYREVISKFSPYGSILLQRQVVMALGNKIGELALRREFDEARTTYDKMIADFGKKADAEIAIEVANGSFNFACALALQDDVKGAIEALKDWQARLGSFDCEMVLSEDNFDQIRDHPDFVQFLEENGCDYGSTASGSDPNATDLKGSDEAAGPGSE